MALFAAMRVVGCGGGDDGSVGTSTEAGCRPPTFKSGCYYSECVKGMVCEGQVDGGLGPDVCGNGVKEGSEECDGDDVSGGSCDVLTHGDMPGGLPSCTSGCTYDVSTCGSIVSGDGMRACGGATCAGVPIPGIPDSPFPSTGPKAWSACCPDGEGAATCGVNLGALMDEGLLLNRSCQLRAQPGGLDSDCPDTRIDLRLPNTFGGPALPIELPGCCRPDGTCGRLMDTVSFTALVPLTLEPGVGCVSLRSFTDAGTPRRCGSGAPRDASLDARPGIRDASSDATTE